MNCMKKKAKQIWLLMTTLILIILGSCDNRRKNTSYNKEYYFYEEELPMEYFERFHPKEYNELFQNNEEKKTIKPSGTCKEDKPLLLSNEYNPFEIAPREINIGKPLIDVRIKDDSTVICVYVEITTIIKGTNKKERLLTEHQKAKE